MKPLLHRAWHSPTVTSWASVGMRGLSVLLVLPLILTRLSTQEIAVWYLFASVIGLQGLADLGFAPTFARVIAHAMGGAREIVDLRTVGVHRVGEPNWELVERIWRTMRHVYLRLTVAALALVGTVGTLAIWKPAHTLADPGRGWLAWAVIVAVSGATLLGNAFGAYLQGLNEVALLRRWEALTLLGAVVTSFVVLLAGGRLLALVVGNQTWALLNVLRDWQLSRHVARGRFKGFADKPRDERVMKSVWPAAWRSGVGVTFSRGIAYASGLVYAQVATGAALATYLLGLRFIQLINDFAQAPFYSKLPLLARLRAEGRVADQLEVAQRGMRLAYWTFIAGFLAVGFSAAPALRVIHSRADFVGPVLWALLGMAFFSERYGAMHLQLYSTTNRIIWHVANGVAGSLYLLVSLSTLSTLGIYAFPVGFLIGNAGFYSWYCAMHSYRSFGIGLRYERSTLIPPLLVMLVFVILAAFGTLAWL